MVGLLILLKLNPMLIRLIVAPTNASNARASSERQVWMARSDCLESANRANGPPDAIALV
jgi:hypothetical protein